MRTVTIEVYAKTERDLESTLEYAVGQLEKSSFAAGGSGHYDDKGFSVTVSGEWEEPAEEEEAAAEEEEAFAGLFPEPEEFFKAQDSGILGSLLRREVKP